MSADRRQFVRSAAGLLLPAAGFGAAVPLVVADEVDLEDRKHRRRRNRRQQKPPTMFADDVAADFRNTLQFPVKVRFKPRRSLAGREVTVERDAESGFTGALAPSAHGTDMTISAHWGRDLYSTIIFNNPEAGKPEVSVSRWKTHRYGDTQDRCLANCHDLSENEFISSDNGFIRVQIHRWSDGTIEEDDHDEECCRFSTTMSHN